MNVIAGQRQGGTRRVLWPVTFLCKCILSAAFKQQEVHFVMQGAEIEKTKQ